jgi:hypothetical protein
VRVNLIAAALARGTLVGEFADRFAPAGRPLGSLALLLADLVIRKSGCRVVRVDCGWSAPCILGNVRRDIEIAQILDGLMNPRTP